MIVPDRGRQAEAARPGHGRGAMARPGTRPGSRIAFTALNDAGADDWDFIRSAGNALMEINPDGSCLTKVVLARARAGAVAGRRLAAGSAAAAPGRSAAERARGRAR